MALTHSSSTATSPSRFYSLGPTWATKYYWAYADKDAPRELAALGFRELGHFRGRAVLDVREGTVAADFIWNDLLLPVVSKRVIEILLRNEIEFFSTFEVTVRRGSKAIPGYLGLAILGRGGPNDSKAYQDGPLPGSQVQRVKGLFPTAWDGSDLFTLEDAKRLILATERVRVLFKHEKVTNCRFTPAEEFSVGYSTWPPKQR